MVLLEWVWFKGREWTDLLMSYALSIDEVEGDASYCNFGSGKKEAKRSMVSELHMLTMSGFISTGIIRAK